ncbi:MAG: ABC transporter substrate-binding protein [Candidatus Omnitrophota bacterium]|jgi:iron complex transport system substrate-binding protein
MIPRFLSFLSVFLLFSPAAYPAESPRPERIVSINLCADELLLRLADPSQIAGVTAYPKTADAEAVLAKAPGIRKIRGSTEEVLALKPDLVLAGRFTHQGTVRFLERMGIPVLAVPVPRSFEEIYQNLKLVAAAAGYPSRGEETIGQMRSALAGAGWGAGNPPKVLFLQSEGYVPGRETFEDDILRIAGAVNLADSMGIREYGRMSLEAILFGKPDLLIFTEDQKDRASVRGSILSHPAIRKGTFSAKTVVLPACLLHCGSPSSVAAVRLLREKMEEK